MEITPGIITRLYEFAWALLPYWWLLVPGGIFAVEPMIEGLAPAGWKSVIDSKWPKRKRHRLFRWASVIALLIASFLAFDDVNARYRELHNRLATASQHSGDSSLAPQGLEFTLVDRITFENDGRGSETRHRIVILALHNKLARELTGLSTTMTKAIGPEKPEQIPVPRNMKGPDHLNPLAYFETEIAGYQESPPSDRLCLLIAPYDLMYPCGLWSSKTSVEYTFFSTAAESLPATISVKIWVENNQLHYKVL